MTRKHFERVADIVASAEVNNRTRHTLAESFAEMFRDDNPRFDTVRFIDACGVKYTVRRTFDDGRPAKTIRRGLTLTAAQTHCRRDDTHGVLRSGVRWFDGYEVQ